MDVMGWFRRGTRWRLCDGRREESSGELDLAKGGAADLVFRSAANAGGEPKEKQSSCRAGRRQRSGVGFFWWSRGLAVKDGLRGGRDDGRWRQATCKSRLGIGRGRGGVGVVGERERERDAAETTGEAWTFFWGASRGGIEKGETTRRGGPENGRQKKKKRDVLGKMRERKKGLEGRRPIERQRGRRER